jgi:hypothetical protein
VPFTLAHPAAVLLFRRTPLPVAAMVAGSMSPDVPVFFKAYGRPYHLTHSALGVVSVDLAMGVLAVAFWFAFLRDPIVDVLPATVRERLAPQARYQRAQWALVVPAVVLGSTTHVFWDLFTHRDRWGVRQIDWLQHQHGDHPGFKWAQFGSSVVGLTVVTCWAVLVLFRLERRQRPVTVPVLGFRALAVVLALTVGTGVGIASATAEPGIGHWLAQAAVLGTITGGFLLLVLAAAWQLQVHRPTSG